MRWSKILAKLGIAACALSAANAFAFFGTEVENYRPNPWLDRPFQAGKANAAQQAQTSPAAGATRAENSTAKEACERRAAESERLSRERDYASRYAR